MPRISDGNQERAHSGILLNRILGDLSDDARISTPEGGPSEGTPCNLDVDWATCLVCRSPIRGADDMVNSHLGQNKNTSLISDAVELKLGVNICVERDPKNVKDPNTIKVIYMEHGCHQMLGFLPRELAKYLSPLIEKYYLRFEGTVLSLPECSLDVVPIQLNCDDATQYVEMGESDHQVFESLRHNVIQVVKASKRFPLNMPKYQQNFCFLIQVVLKSHAHAFTDDEKLFLESFNSLSDNSQRLFIRLYARKDALRSQT